MTNNIAHGIILGGAVGDALGAPYEFRPRGTYKTWRDTIGRHQNILNEMVGSTGVWQPGEATDDTQMAVALAQSIIANRGLNKTDLWTRWREWRLTAKDVGILTSVALSCDEWEGAALEAHQQLGRSAGNGALMRSYPLAVYLAHQPLDYDQFFIVYEQAEMTHHDIAAADGAGIHTTALVQAQLSNDDPITHIDRMVRLGAVPGWEELLAPDYDPYAPTMPSGAKHYSNGTVWGCLAQAVWAVRHSDSFVEAVENAVNLGDDADTVACVAGSLAGARYGLQDIPERWLEQVFVQMDTPDGRIVWGYEELMQLTAALVSV